MSEGIRHGRAGWPTKISVLATALTTVVALGVVSTASGAASKPREKTLTIGVIAGLTGTASSTATPQVNGMKAWLKVQGGKLDRHRIVFNFCDSQSTVPGGLACAQRLSSSGIVIDVGSTAQLQADGPVLQAAGKVELTPDPTLNPAAGSNVFQTVPELANGVKTFLGAAVASGFKSLGVITTDDASGTAINAAISGAAKHLGLTVTSELIADTATDATVQVEALQAAKVGMIYDGIVGTEGVYPLMAAKELGMTTPIVVNAGDVYASFLAAAKGSILGSIYGAPPSNLAVPTLLNPAQRLSFAKFDARYKKVTGKLMNLVAANFIGVTQASTAAEILLKLGAKPSLTRTESYLLTQGISGVVGVRFTKSPQVVTNSVGLAEASSTARVWGACKTTTVLQCPAA